MRARDHVSVPRAKLLETIRLAVRGLARGRSYVVAGSPDAVSEAWLRKYVNRLHSRGSARYHVHAIPRGLVVHRGPDAVNHESLLDTTKDF